MVIWNGARQTKEQPWTAMYTVHCTASYSHCDIHSASCISDVQGTNLSGHQSGFALNRPWSDSLKTQFIQNIHPGLLFVLTKVETVPLANIQPVWGRVWVGSWGWWTRSPPRSPAAAARGCAPAGLLLWRQCWALLHSSNWRMYELCSGESGLTRSPFASRIRSPGLSKPCLSMKESMMIRATITLRVTNREEFQRHLFLFRCPT